MEFVSSYKHDPGSTDPKQVSTVNNNFLSI